MRANGIRFVQMPHLPARFVVLKVRRAIESSFAPGASVSTTLQEPIGLLVPRH